MRWAGHEVQIGERMNECRLLLRMPEGKSTLGRPRHSCVDIITMALGEIRWTAMDWIYLA
jgi:hypothetical protein